MAGVNREQTKCETSYQKPGGTIIIPVKIEPLKEMQRIVQWQKASWGNNHPKLNDLYILLRKLGPRIKYSKITKLVTDGFRTWIHISENMNAGPL